MQIYYCDACGLRVNNAELVPAGDKVYCQACAEKQAAVAVPAPAPAMTVPRRTPSGGVILTSRPKTDGYVLPPAPQRATTGQQRPPSPAFGSGHSHTAHRSTSGHERPRSGNTGSIPRPASASARATMSKNDANATLIYAAAGAGAMLLVTLIVFAMRTPPDQSKAPETATTAKANDPEPKSLTQLKPPEPAKLPDPVKKPVEMDDIRERIARREFEITVKRIRETPGDVLATRSAMQDFIRRYRSTQAGQEALAMADKMLKIDARTPDAASGTQPGLKCELYERPNDWEEIRNRDLRTLKKYKDMLLADVNIPNRGTLESVFSRGEYLGAVITGYIEVPADGEYTFGLSSDDASFLFIGDWHVIDHDGPHPASEYSETVPLKKGKHRMRINYSQGMGEAALQFFWSGPGITKQLVPASALSHDQ